jgi:endonuclease VIII
VLFEAGVDPFARVASLPDERLAALIAIARRQLAVNVREGSMPRARGRRTTGRMAPDEGVWVYGRGGRPCRRCGTPIAAAKQGITARLTYWCPNCQR